MCAANIWLMGMEKPMLAKKRDLRIVLVMGW
jgi:hypothetical protein